MGRELVDSGVEWIGEIPKQWGIGKVKHIFYRSKEVNKTENPTVLSLARSGIRERDISTNEGQLAASYDNYNVVKKGDLLLNPMDLISGANCNYSFVDGVISPAYVNLRKKGKASSKYFDYYFKLQYWHKAFFAHGKGVSFENRWTLNNETLMNYPVPLPTTKEQQKIANFLDEKTAQIDSIMEKTKLSIEELKYYKQSLITETVTKGLNPNVEKKDSGNKTIPSYPKHWKYIRIKYLLRERKERSTHGQEEPLSMSQKMGLIPSQELDIPNPPSSGVGGKIVVEGDLVFNKLKAHLGVFSVSKYNGLVSPDYAVYFNNNSEVNTKYLEYLFKTPNYINEFKRFSKGVAIGLTRLYTSDLFNIKCTLPPLDEQEDIVNYIENKTLHINSLISNKERLLEEILEYKKSLINEYVTGKKEVM